MRRASILFVRAAPLSSPSITRALQDLHGWRVDGNKHNAICRDFEFPDFKQAMAFMNAVAADCEAAQHHPCWTNVYNKLHVQLTTHDAGNRVTQKDVSLAKIMNEKFDSQYRETRK